MSGELAARKTINGTLCVDGALDAFSAHAVRPCAALAEITASRAAASRAGPTWRGAPTRSTVRRSDGRGACVGRCAPGPARAARLCIELEALIAGRVERNESSERRQDPQWTGRA